MTDEPSYLEDPDAIVTVATDGDIEIAEQLLAGGADINATDEFGETAVRIVAAVMDDAGSEGRHHRQYGSFTRVGHGIVRVVVAHGNRFRECIGREAIQLAGGIAHALEKLRHDRARIAAGTVQQRIGDRCQQAPQVLFIALLKNR